MQPFRIFPIVILSIALSACVSQPVKPPTTPEESAREADIVKAMEKEAWNELRIARNKTLKRFLKEGYTHNTSICSKALPQTAVRAYFYGKSNPNYQITRSVYLSDSYLPKFKAKLIDRIHQLYLVTNQYQTNLRRYNLDNGRFKGVDTRDVLILGTGDAYFSIRTDTSVAKVVNKYNLFNRFTITVCQDYRLTEEKKFKFVGDMYKEPNDEQIKRILTWERNAKNRSKKDQSRQYKYQEEGIAKAKASKQAIWNGLLKGAEESFAVTPEQKHALWEKRNREAENEAVIQYKIRRYEERYKERASKENKLQEYTWYEMGNGYTHTYVGKMKKVTGGELFSYASGEKVRETFNQKTGEGTRVFYVKSITAQVKDRNGGSYFIVRPIMKVVESSRNESRKERLDKVMGSHEGQYYFKDWNMADLSSLYMTTIRHDYDVIKWY